MNAQERPAMTPDDFKAWRERMAWSQAQAAHVLMVGVTSVAAYENGRNPIDGHVAHLCQSAEMLRTLNNGSFFGNALEVVRAHHAALQARMDEAEKMPGRGRPRLAAI